MDVKALDGIEICNPAQKEWTLHAAPQCPLSGRYTLLEQLGASPGRRTILARDEKDGGCVVLKVLDAPACKAPGCCSVDALRDRADLLTTIRHPHIAHLLDWFEFLDENGGHKFALVWEFVEGESVRQAAARGRTFSDGELVSVAEDVLSGLVHLHGQSGGIVHGRISPGNVVITTIVESCGRSCSWRTVACLIDLDPLLDTCCDSTLDPLSPFLPHHAWRGFPGWAALRRLGPGAQCRTEVVLTAGVLMLMRTGRPPLLRACQGWLSRVGCAGGGYLNIEEMYLQEGVKPDFGLVTVLFRMGRMTRRMGHVFPLNPCESCLGCAKIAGCNPKTLMRMSKRCSRGVTSAADALRCLRKLESGGGHVEGGQDSWDSFQLARERHPLLRSGCEAAPAQTVGWVDRWEMRCWPGARYIVLALYYLAVCHAVFIPAVMLETDKWWECCLALFGFLPLWLISSLLVHVIMTWRGHTCRKLVFLSTSLLWWGTETLCQVPLILLTLLIGDWPFDHPMFLLLLFFWVLVLAMVDIGLAVAVGKEGFVAIGDWILTDAVWYKAGGRDRRLSLTAGHSAAMKGVELYF